MLELKRGKGKGGKKWCDHYHQTEFFRSASRLLCHSLRHPLASNRRWSIQWQTTCSERVFAIRGVLLLHPGQTKGCFADQKTWIRRKPCHGLYASVFVLSNRDLVSRFPFLSYADTDGSQYLYSSCLATHLEASYSFHALTLPL